MPQIDALSEVVSAVKGSDVEVYLDGGVRQGTDILKALALGARAVFVGRPVLWGLAYAGREGVEQVLGMLRDEFTLAMQLAGKRPFTNSLSFNSTHISLLGCAKITDITPELVVHESHYKFPRAKF